MSNMLIAAAGLFALAVLLAPIPTVQMAPDRNDIMVRDCRPPKFVVYTTTAVFLEEYRGWRMFGICRNGRPVFITFKDDGADV